MYRRTKLQKLPEDGFNWVKSRSQFYKDLTENCNEDSDKEYLLKVDVQYLEKIHNLYKDLPNLPERMKIENVEKLAR